MRCALPPTTAHDMEALFKPVPFGYSDHVGPFEQIASPLYAALWDHFRSIDMDKECKVLQVRCHFIHRS